MENLARPQTISYSTAWQYIYKRGFSDPYKGKPKKRQERTLPAHKENLGITNYWQSSLKNEINIWTLIQCWIEHWIIPQGLTQAVPVCISFTLGALSLKPSFSVQIEKVYTVAGSRLENVAASWTTFWTYQSKRIN